MISQPANLDPACHGKHRIEFILDSYRASGLSERGLSFLRAALTASHMNRCDRCASRATGAEPR